jgi:hypothetical protein
MHVLLIVATPDAAFCQAVDSRQGLLVPESFRRNNHEAFGGARFVLSCLKETSVSLEQVRDHADGMIDDRTVGVAVLADRRLGLGGRPLSDVFFVNEFDQHGTVKSPQNFLTALLNRVLRDFRALSIRFEQAKYQKILRLPLRNFLAPEIDDLRTVCLNAIDQAAFADRLDAQLAPFRERQHPKRKGSYAAEYLVDDADKHFELGHERHARAERAIPPHDPWCIAANRHRFGRKFDGDQHYNVSMDGENTRMTGAYPDCHGQYRGGGEKRHLNMFTSDFF